MLLISVYLMYTFRPLSAWNHFYQAATFYRLRLRMIDGLDTSAYETEQQGAPVTERLEQSLYWSCFKSEVEIRVELPLPQSAIAEYEYPALFPTPPTLSDVYPENDYQGQGWTSTQTPSRSAEDSQANRRHPLFGRAGVDVRNHILKLFDEEQSWYYYLTEVALRRIGNRVQNAFYRGEPSSWSNIKPLIPIALEFESQIHAWSANLPATMQYYANETASGHARQGASSSDTQDSISLELSWAIGNRFLEIRLWLYQPFLYFAAHYPIEATASPVTETASLALTPEEARTVRGLVQSGLDCSMKILDARCLRHRHHGIWFDLRALVTASLIFIALAKGGNIDLPGIDSPGGIRSRLDRTLEALDYWEDEAPDIKKARRVLEDLIRETS